MISADPTVPDAFYSQAFNRFAYVYGSPLVYVDPSGYCGTSNINWHELRLGTFHAAEGVVVTGAGLTLFAAGIGGSIESFGASLGAAELGAAGVYIGIHRLGSGVAETYDSFNGTVYQDSIPDWAYAAMEGAIDPVVAVGDVTVDTILKGSTDQSCNTPPQDNSQRPPAPPKTPKTPAPPSSGGENRNGDRNPGSWVPVCSRVYTDWYSGSPSSPFSYFQFTTSSIVCN